MENNIHENQIAQECNGAICIEPTIYHTLTDQNNSPAEKNDAENVSTTTTTTTATISDSTALVGDDGLTKLAGSSSQQTQQQFLGNVFASAVVASEQQRDIKDGTAEEDDDDDDEDDANYETDDSDDNSSDDSDFSDLSGMSDVSGREWKPAAATKPINWVQKQIQTGANPRELLSQILPNGTAAAQIAPGMTDMTLWRILASMLSEPPRRRKLPEVRTFNDVIELLKVSKNVIVLTGAGVSVSCGIPDFRSSDGIYSRLAKDFPDLPDPQAMFDISYFSRDPRPFYKFAREIYPGQFTPSPCHRFIKLLEKKQKLLRNYTQNIDTLERVAGIQNVIECHGSFSTASCTKCKFKTTADDIRDDIFAQRIPVCPKCQPNVTHSSDASDSVAEGDLKRIVENGIMKPDIVFFGEGLPEEFHTVMASDKDKCDLLIVMGSSLKVRPVALIPSSIPAQVPQILINREQLRHLEFDVELLGDSDVIINQICHQLGEDWTEICYDPTVLTEAKTLNPHPAEDETAAIGNQDTDTLSVKSSTSTDTALRSTGYSDSGFESSTSSMVQPMSRPEDIPTCSTRASFSDIPLFKEQEDTAAASLKDGVLDLNNREEEGFEPEIEDEESESFTFDGQLQKKPENCNYRHLSIDSSKDSGICDSNSVSCGVALGNGIPGTDVGGGGGGGGGSGENTNGQSGSGLGRSSSSSNDSGASKNQNDVVDSIDCIPSTSSRRNSAWPRNKHAEPHTAAERLMEGTYYCHESSCSYIFPGAQVSWSSDTEDSDNDDDYEDDEPATMSPATPSTEELPPPCAAPPTNEPTEIPSPVTSQSSPISIASVSTTKRTSSTLDSSFLSNCNSPPEKKLRSLLDTSSSTVSSGSFELFSGSTVSSASIDFE